MRIQRLLLPLVGAIVAVGWFLNSCEAPRELASGPSSTGGRAIAIQPTPEQGIATGKPATPQDGSPARTTPSSRVPDTLDTEDSLHRSADLFDAYFSNAHSRVPAQALMARRAHSYCLAAHQAKSSFPDASTAGSERVDTEALKLLSSRCGGFDFSQPKETKALQDELSREAAGNEDIDLEKLTRADLERVLASRNPVVLLEVRDALWTIVDRQRATSRPRRLEPDLRDMAFQAALCEEGLYCEADSAFTLAHRLFLPAYTSGGDRARNPSYGDLMESVLASERGDLQAYRRMQQQMRPILRDYLARGDTRRLLLALAEVR